MLDDHDDTTRHDEHGFTRQGFADKSANRISAAKAAPASPAAAQPDANPTARRPRLELSLTQILGSTSAAVTAAFLGSRLGVAGTLIGAALASVISVVGGAIYTSSIKATRRRMAQVIVAVRSPDESPAPEPAPVLMPLAGRRSMDDGLRGGFPGAPDRRRRPVLQGLAIGAVLSAAVFAGALAIVTGYETVSGTALSGGQVGGLTILGGSGLDTGASDTAPPGNSGPSKRSANDGVSATTTAVRTPTSGQTVSSAATSRVHAPAGTAPVPPVPTVGTGQTVGTAPTGAATTSGSTTRVVPPATTVTSPVTPTGSSSPSTRTSTPTGQGTSTSSSPAPTSSSEETTPGPDPTTSDGGTSSDGSATAESTETTAAAPPGANTPR